MSARALMVLGTSSHAGKSTITAALCRILANEGVHVAPFKAQNMSLNSAATPDGREIGRAQALQAEACRIAPRVEMNPVLIKPSSDTGSQIVLLGKIWGQVTAAGYHTRRVEELFPTVLESYRRLASEFEVIVLEGAGSPAEINLREHDIVNMRMARAAAAACLLVGDIDRGGVFASLLGTMELLEEDERAFIRGYAINKFRGDQSLLMPGIAMMEPRLRVPCAGVIPYLHDLGLDEEDGVALEDRRTSRAWRGIDFTSAGRPLRIGIVAFPHMSNFTDFDALAAEPSVSVAFLERAADLGEADVVILPGTKQTLSDLEWLRRNGFAEQVLQNGGKKRPLAGICGGFQMLGLRIEDPHGIESGSTPSASDGLGMLTVGTKFGVEKTTSPVTGTTCEDRGEFRGYEIHVGDTTYVDGAKPFATIRRQGGTGERPDGAISADGRVWGTYVHGLFDDDRFRHGLIARWREQCGLAPAGSVAFVAAERDRRLNRLADHVRSSLNMQLIKSWIGL